MQEVIFSDGSISTFTEGGGGSHVGDLAIERLRLKTAALALEIKLRPGGMELTRNGATLAIQNVIQPRTGKTYKRSRKGKEEALADCRLMLAAIEGDALVMDSE
jgi:hypothetical protein